MPRAVVFFAYGGPEVLQIVEVPEPQAGPGQVRVRVKAAGVNPVECKLRRGYFEGRVPVTFPARLGNEYAGVVDQVGEGVTEHGVGDEVLGSVAAEGYADYVVVNAVDTVRKPTTRTARWRRDTCEARWLCGSPEEQARAQVTEEYQVG